MGEAWIPLPSEEEVRERFGPFDYDYGSLPRMTKLMFAHEGIGSALGRVTSQVMFGPGRLSRRERELVATVTAAAQKCPYCAETHGLILRVEGGAEQIATAVKEGRWRDVEQELNLRERVLCQVAEKLSATPYKMTREDWTELEEAGLDKTAWLEVAHIVGMFNYLTRLASAFGLEMDEATAGDRAAGP